MDKEQIKLAFQLGYATAAKNLVKQSQEIDDEDAKAKELRRRREKVIKILAALGGAYYGGVTGAGIGAGLHPMSAKSSRKTEALLGSLLGAGIGGGLGYGVGAAGNALARYVGLDPFTKTVRVETAKSPVQLG